MKIQNKNRRVLPKMLGMDNKDMREDNHSVTVRIQQQK
jgi:hypothetical protein